LHGQGERKRELGFNGTTKLFPFPSRAPPDFSPSLSRPFLTYRASPCPDAAVFIYVALSFLPVPLPLPLHPQTHADDEREKGIGRRVKGFKA